MTASKLKLILAAALFAVPVPISAHYQSLTPPPNWEMTLPGARQWSKDVCSERDSLRSDRACYAAFLRQQARERAALCRQEIIGRNEGLIATAPTNWEVDAGISVANPTPACHHRRAP